MIDNGRGHDQPQRALCVDDEPSTLSLVSRLLEQMDLVVTTADRPQKALELFEPDRPEARLPGGG